MIKIKLKKLESKSVLMIMILILMNVMISCNTDSIFWQVKSVEITINDDWKYLEESNPGLLNDKFTGQFPKGLQEGDVLEINYDSKRIIVNQIDTFSFYSKDSILNLRYTDLIYPLTLFKSDEKIKLVRTLRQGEIKWILSSQTN